jgi:hypothetical protein
MRARKDKKAASDVPPGKPGAKSAVITITTVATSAEPLKYEGARVVYTKE